jgi:ketosteroid isomerase-like protein
MSTSAPGPNPHHTIIRMLLRSIDAAEWTVVEALFHPQAEYEVSGHPVMKGREAIMNYYRHARDVRRGEHIVEAIVAEGKNAACWGRFTATRADNSAFSILFADTMQFEQAKIRKRRVYYCEPGRKPVESEMLKVKSGR